MHVAGYFANVLPIGTSRGFHMEILKYRSYLREGLWGSGKEGGVAVMVPRDNGPASMSLGAGKKDILANPVGERS